MPTPRSSARGAGHIFRPKRDSCFGPKHEARFFPKSESCFCPNRDSFPRQNVDEKKRKFLSDKKVGAQTFTPASSLSKNGKLFPGPQPGFLCKMN